MVIFLTKNMRAGAILAIVSIWLRVMCPQKVNHKSWSCNYWMTLAVLYLSVKRWIIMPLYHVASICSTGTFPIGGQVARHHTRKDTVECRFENRGPFDSFSIILYVASDTLFVFECPSFGGVTGQRNLELLFRNRKSIFKNKLVFFSVIATCSKVMLNGSCVKSTYVK